MTSGSKPHQSSRSTHTTSCRDHTGYDSDALRQVLAARGAWACVKPIPNRWQRPAFSAILYRQRNLVERFFNELKHFRAVAVRFENDPENYIALVKLAAARICMRFMSR